MRYGKSEGAVVEVVTASGKTYMGKLHWLDSNEVAIIRQKLLVSFHKKDEDSQYERIADNCKNLTLDEPECNWIHINCNLIESWRYVRFLDVANNAALKNAEKRNNIYYYYNSNYTELLCTPTQTIGATKYDESTGGYCFGNESLDKLPASDETDSEIMEDYIKELYEKSSSEEEELVHEETPEESEKKVQDMVYDVLQRYNA